MTREAGRVDVVAKGSRKSGSRLAAASEPLVRSRLQVASGRQRTFITQAQVQTSHPWIRSDYDRLQAALAVAEVFSAVAMQDQPDVESFELLEQTLDEFKQGKPIVVACWSCCRLLAVQGLSPSWTRCAVCGVGADQNPAWFCAEAGGMVCREHAGESMFARLVRVEALIALDRLAAMSAPPANLRFAVDCLSALHLFGNHHAHRSLPAFGSLLESVKHDQTSSPE